MNSKGFILVVALSAALVSFLGVALCADWLSGWSYRRPVTIVNTCNGPLEEYQVLIRLEEGFDFSKALENGDDIRFIDSDGTTPLPFWIEDWNASAETGSFWVRLQLIELDETQLFIYYGNSSAVPSADPGQTFDTYDGFEDYDLGSAPTASDTNPGEWTRYEGNPLITEGPLGAWDDHGATFASVIYDSLTGEFRMYYHGFSFSGVHQIGLATSPDGLSWTKYPGNPIMTPGPASWDGQSVRVPMVWKEGLTDYRMIYTGNGSGGMRVGYATSSDGISWTKHPANPVFNDPTWASGQTENWGVMKVGDEYLMWYSNFGMRQSGIAVSTDLVTWTPHTPGPIFASSGDPNDDRYSQFCPFSFKYGAYYYVLVPSYTSVANYSSFYLYRSSSPYFPEADRHLVRIAHTVGGTGSWEGRDNDTPFVFTLDIERTEFFNDELWCYYAAEGGGDLWKMGLLIEPDITVALSNAPLPDKSLTWSASGNVQVVDSPVRHGVRSVRLRDTSSTSALSLSGTFSSRSTGRIGAWMRRTSTSYGDTDIYLYGGAALACVAGLGRDGDFHYWNGAFQPTGVAWTTDTWYLVTLAFNTSTARYDFIVYDTHLNETVRIEGIDFGGAAALIDRGMFYTSGGYVGDCFVDDFRLMKWCGGEHIVAIGAEQDPVVSTYLLDYSVSFGGSFIELTWMIVPNDVEARFSVLRSEMPSGPFNPLINATFERDDFRFSVRDNDINPGTAYRYRVDIDTGSQQWTLLETDPVSTTPSPLLLEQNYPNPFNPATVIRFQLPERTNVTLDIYDTAGRKVARLVEDTLNPGRHAIEWNGRSSDGGNASSGVYFYRIAAGKEIISRKMVLLR